MTDLCLLSYCRQNFNMYFFSSVDSSPPKTYVYLPNNTFSLCRHNCESSPHWIHLESHWHHIFSFYIHQILECHIETGMYNSKLKLDNKYKCWFNTYTTWINQWIEHFGHLHGRMCQRVLGQMSGENFCSNHLVCTHSFVSFLWSATNTFCRVHLIHHWRFPILTVILMTCDSWSTCKFHPPPFFALLLFLFFPTVMFLISVHNNCISVWIVSAESLKSN